MASSHASTTSPFFYNHVTQNLSLVFLSLIILPISSSLVLFSLVYAKIRPLPKPLAFHNGDASRKTILVTGVSMTKGLTIARLLAQHTPHRIIGADTSPFSPGRFSSSLSAFYGLTLPDGEDADPYIDSLLAIMKKENVGLWISCSSVVAAVEDGEVVRLAEAQLGKGFRAIQFREDVVERLHEKDRFIEYVRSLGLTVPESHRCTSVEEVLDVLLREEGKRKFILKPIGVDDKARANMMTLLPFSSPQDTASYVKGLQVSTSNPFQLQQYIDGQEYCTHALIIRGRVAAFTACPSSELLMHYEALSPSSQLTQEMLKFTKTVAEDGGPSFSGHLSFDFLVPDAAKGLELYPIECNPRAHTAVVLFSDTPQMAGAYLSALSDADDSVLDVKELVVPRTPTPAYYWIGNDLVSSLILPLLDMLWGQAALDEVIDGWTDFWEHLIFWRDGTFTVWDPVPFFVLYHVYWPVQFIWCLWKGKKWSRINVSTTKIFES